MMYVLLHAVELFVELLLNYHASVSTWISKADRMNKDFFSCFRQRPAGAMVIALRDSLGQLHTCPDEILEMTSVYYETLFTLDLLTGEVLDARDEVWSFVRPVVSGDMQTAIMRPFYRRLLLPNHERDSCHVSTERYKILSQLSRFNARETVPESKVEVLKKLDHLGGMVTSEILNENKAIVLLASSSHVEAGCTIETNNSVQGLSMKMRNSSRRKQVENQDYCMLRGVYYKNMKWQAAIKVEKKQIHLGTVATMEEAAHLYDRAAYLCGRVPNFELSEEEKQELQGLQWEEFLLMTKEAIASKKKRKRIETCIRRRHTSAPGEEGEIDRQPFYQLESESLHQPIPCDGHASFHHATTFPETLPFYCTTSFHPTGAVLHSQ
ncbi:hypothetical protein L7F22_042675 [Adiantum nelumboides]|nr:hypothetical protein [Adiantum nelumboides]